MPPERTPLPRDCSWDYYGISKSRRRALREICRSGKYSVLMRSAARDASPEFAEYILLSVQENLSFDELEALWTLRKIPRMPCCRTDFYGYRRLFYAMLDRALKRQDGGRC